MLSDLRDLVFEVLGTKPYCNVRVIQASPRGVNGRINPKCYIDYFWDKERFRATVIINGMGIEEVHEDALKRLRTIMEDSKRNANGYLFSPVKYSRLNFHE